MLKLEFSNSTELSIPKNSIVSHITPCSSKDPRHPKVDALVPLRCLHPRIQGKLTASGPEVIDVSTVLQSSDEFLSCVQESKTKGIPLISLPPVDPEVLEAPSTFMNLEKQFSGLLKFPRLTNTSLVGDLPRIFCFEPDDPRSIDWAHPEM